MIARCAARGCQREPVTTCTDGAGLALELCEEHGDALAVGFPLRGPSGAVRNREIAERAWGEHVR